MSRALERLSEGAVIVADGGTGALLTAAVSRLRCPEEANLKAPEAVVKVHLGFIRAGAELIEANTFGANRRKLSAQLLDDRLDEIVETGVKLAREARDVSGSPVLVAGSLGPLGDLEGSHGAENAYDVFHEQARLLEGRGVDLFMVETFFDLEELETAIAAVKDASSLPIVAQLTFDEDAETLAGVSAGEAVVRLRGLGVVAIGANCGVGPQAARSPTSGCRAARAGASSIRTRRRTTSPSSRRRRAISARGSSAAAAVRLRPRSRRSEQRSRRRANRAWRCSSSSAK
jgi:methionine synthase I (cobalamin-dependent)